MSRQPSDVRAAVVAVDAGSQSSDSSTSAADRRAEPEATAESHFSFCAALPPSARPRPPSTTLAKYGPGYAARPSSSCTRQSSTSPSPAPPYSSAKGRPSQPSLAISPQRSSP